MKGERLLEAVGGRFFGRNNVFSPVGGPPPWEEQRLLLTFWKTVLSLEMRRIMSLAAGGGSLNSK